LALVLSLGLCPPALAVEETPGVTLLTGKFDSPAYPDRELSYQFPYTDSYFTEWSGELYNHQLAQCTLGLAVSAFRSMDQSLDRKDEYIRSYLAQAGFGDMVSDQFDQEPTAETIATLLASKKLRDEEGEFTLVALAVSGGGYQDEWLSNFSFGDYVVHEGFFSAAFTVFERLFDYVDAHADGGRYKIWMGGYSRAAAVSNMTAVLALSAEQVASEDLYVYTFATPNNCKPDQIDLGYDYSSIFNITGMFDPVPAIPFAEWGYSKLGTTYRLPAQETTPDYEARREPVAAVYREITGEAYTNNPEANWFIQKIYQMLYDMANTAGDYQDKLQAVFDSAWENKSGVLKLLRGMCGVLSQDKPASATLAGEVPTANTLLSVFLYDLGLEKLGLEEDSWNDLNLMMQLFYEHCPEVYISWMMSQDDPARLFVFDTDYRRVFLDDKVAWTLMDEDHAPVERLCAHHLGKAVMITVPSDRTYILSLSGGAHPTEVVKVMEYNAGSLHYAYKFYEMDSKGGTYELTLPMDYWSGENDGGLVKLPGQRIEPLEAVLDRSAVQPSAVFELMDIGWLASHALDVALGIVIALTAAAAALAVLLIAVLTRRGRQKKAAVSAKH